MNTVNVRAYCIRPTLTAIIAIATAFTLTACNEQPTNSGDGDPSSSSGGGNLSSSGGNSSSNGASSSSSGEIERGSVSYGVKSYETVKIGEQWWMAENLDYDAPGSECYTDIPPVDCYEGTDCNQRASYCGIYGRLYDWETAIDICPAGWHLPSKAEWEELFSYTATDEYGAGIALKAREGWNGVKGEDTYGFRALPGGLRSNTYGTDDVYMGFYDIREGGYWWTSTPDIEEVTAHNTKMRHDSGEVSFGSANVPSSPKSDLMSVRCVRDRIQPRTQE